MQDAVVKLIPRKLMRVNVFKPEEMTVVKPEDVIGWITVQMGERSITQFATDLGVGRQTLYDVLSGARPPSKSLLKRLGLRVVYQIVAPEATPAKRKKSGKGE